MSSCGLWVTPRRLVAVVVDANFDVHPPLCVRRTEDGLWGLCTSLSTMSCAELVVTDTVARSDHIARLAHRLGVRLWIAPAKAVDEVRQLMGFERRHAKFSAILLARWPRIGVLRQYLRVLVHEPEQQLLPFVGNHPG